MGCISSKKEFDDSHPYIFQVMNVDDLGNPLSPGQLEITDVDLIFYQRGKAPVKWPLRTLRRYGFDCEVFSFESGRRCPTGPGIYAFRCRRAEQLFNLMQNRIQLRSNADNDTLAVFPTVGNARGESNYLEPAPLRRSRSSVQNIGDVMMRLSSVGSASGSLGPLSPQSGSIPSELAPQIPQQPATTPAPHKTSSQNLYANDDIAASLVTTNCIEETNNNKQQSPTTPTSQHMYANFNMTDNKPKEDVIQESSYEMLSDMSSPKIDEDRVYVNVLPGSEQFSPTVFNKQNDWDNDETKRCYANLDPSELETLALLTKCVPSTPPAATGGVTVNKNINYIVLDLKPSNCDPPKSPTNSVPPDSPKKTAQEGYVTIDFDKTVALSHSVNPNFDNTDTSRKTRHNSTINDLISQSRNSSSLSD